MGTALSGTAVAWLPGNCNTVFVLWILFSRLSMLPSGREGG